MEGDGIGLAERGRFVGITAGEVERLFEFGDGIGEGRFLLVGAPQVDVCGHEAGVHGEDLLALVDGRWILAGVGEAIAQREVQDGRKGSLDKLRMRFSP